MIHIRKVQEKDVFSLLQLAQDICQNSPFCEVLTVEEISQFSVEDKIKDLESFKEKKNSVFFVAYVEDQLVGSIKFSGEKWTRLSHTGFFGISVKKEFRNQGIGKLLIEHLLLWAKENPFVEKVSLKVHATNERAIHLYKKCGFVVEGIEKNQICYGADHYVDALLMSQFTPFEISSKRLVFRPHTYEDIPFMVELDDDVLTLSDAHHIVTSLRQQFYLEKMGCFMVIEKESGKRIGQSFVRREEGGGLSIESRFLHPSLEEEYLEEVTERLV